MKKLILFLGSILFISVFIVSSYALTGDEVLKKVDEALVRNNQVANLTMTLTDKNGIKQSREIQLFQKEGGKRLIKFLKPADVKGVGFLSLPNDEMYIYMPVLGKVRRIASHVKNQSFMGTDFSYEDIGGEKVSEGNNIKSFKEEEGSYLIEFSSTKKDASYSFVKMIINKETFIPSKTEFYDKAGKLCKVMLNQNVEKVDGKWVAKEIKMTNVKEDHNTVLKMTNMSFDDSISDDVFTQRNLQK